MPKYCAVYNWKTDHDVIIHTACLNQSTLWPGCTCLHAHACVAEKARRCLPVVRERQCSLYTSLRPHSSPQASENNSVSSQRKVPVWRSVEQMKREGERRWRRKALTPALAPLSLSSPLSLSLIHPPNNIDQNIAVCGCYTNAREFLKETCWVSDT